MCSGVAFESNPQRIKEVVTQPSIMSVIAQDCDTPEDYEPDPNNFYFKVGDGLVIYEVQSPHCLEMVGALSPGDLPDRPMQVLFSQWDYLCSLGWYQIYSIVQKHNIKARHICRAAGMELYSSNKINIYTKVIYNGSHRKN